MDYLKGQSEKIVGPGSYGVDGEVHPVPFYRALTIDIAVMYMNYPETGDYHSREIIAGLLTESDDPRAQAYLKWWGKEQQRVAADSASVSTPERSGLA